MWFDQNKNAHLDSKMMKVEKFSLQTHIDGDEKLDSLVRAAVYLLSTSIR